MSAAYLDFVDSKLKIFEKSSRGWNPRLIQKMAFLCKEGIKTNESVLVKINRTCEMMNGWQRETFIQ